MYAPGAGIPGRTDASHAPLLNAQGGKAIFHCLQGIAAIREEGFVHFIYLLTHRDMVAGGMTLEDDSEGVFLFVLFR